MPPTRLLKGSLIYGQLTGHNARSLMSTKQAMMMCPGLIWHTSDFSGSLLG